LVLCFGTFSFSLYAFKPSVANTGSPDTTAPSVNSNSPNLGGFVERGSSLANNSIPGAPSSSPFFVYFPNGSKMNLPPMVELPNGKILMKLADGSQQEILKTITYSNGTTQDTMACFNALSYNWYYMPSYCSEANFDKIEQGLSYDESTGKLKPS
jgi:hypothetical protein